MLELATILKFAAGIVMLLALWGLWVIYRQRRAIAKQNEELKRQKFANKQSRIVAEIAARLGSVGTPRRRTAEIPADPEPRQLPPAQSPSVAPMPTANEAPTDDPVKPARRTMPDPGKLERERRSLANRLAAANPAPATRALDDSASPKSQKDNQALKTRETSSNTETKETADRNHLTDKAGHQPVKPTPQDTGQGDSQQTTRGQQGGVKKLSNSPPLHNPANQLAVPPPAPGPAATASKQVISNKAHPPLSARPLSTQPLPHPAPKPASIQSLDPEVSLEATASRQPPATQQNTQKTEREMALKLAPDVAGIGVKSPADPHVKWRSTEAVSDSEDIPSEAPARNGMKFQAPPFQARPVAKPPPARTKNGRLRIDNEASLPEQINAYAGWLASQSAQFVLERYENGAPVDLIPLWFDAEDLERRKGHWVGLFEPVELAPLMKQIKDADNAIYCPFSDKAVEALRGPALEILANVEANQSHRQQRIIKECALREFVEFLDELKTMAADEV